MERTRYLLTSDVAKVLDLSESGVRNLERRGLLRADRASGRMRIFDAAEVLRLAQVRAQRRQGRPARAASVAK